VSQWDTIRDSYAYPVSPDLDARYPDAVHHVPDQAAPGTADEYPATRHRVHDDEERPKPQPKAAKKLSADAWMAEQSTHFPRLKRRTIALFFLRLPAFLPWFFILRGWYSLNAKDVLTLSEADVLGTGGEFTFLITVSITPLITLTGARWYAPLRRWYGIFFALIGTSDAVTASITTDFAGGVFGRLAGHTFLVTGFLIILIAAPVLLTANTPSQRKLGTYWKKIQKLTYVVWAMIVIHLALLDGFRPFDGPQGDGDPVFHQRLYQIVAISIPLILLRLPPVRRWISDKHAAGQRWRIWCTIAPMAALYLVAFAFIMNEEIFTGLQVMTMHPPAN
jgi:DMSO/TMAO reductase YedYZ heme-binding membrane subunit